MGYRIDKNSHCAVVGHGSMATAMMKVLTMNEASVDWYVHNPEVMESLRTEGHNCRYLADVDFDTNRIHFSDDLNEVVRRSDIIFLITPANYLKDHLNGLEVSLHDKFFVSAIKGIVPGENLLVTNYLKQRYGLCEGQLAFMSGPTHAEEVSHNRLTHLTISCADLDNARVVGEKIKTDFLKLSYSQEMVYLEYISVLKNIYAVVVGMAIGLGYGDNFIAVLVANCAEEMHRFLDLAFGTKKVEKIPSSFMGDLLVSCYSIHGRNRRLGVLIGRGNTVKSSLNEMTMVAEGYFASDYFQYLTPEQRGQMPIAEMAYQVLHKGQLARKAMKRIEGILV
jgi:glycerol-3-phosphate dehydrogenase (NAD(P)+)